MKERILTGWTFQRALFILMGAFIIIQAVQSNEWMGILLGGYFASMGIFGFGCAAGACNYGSPVDKKTNEKIEFTEIK